MRVQFLHWLWCVLVVCRMELLDYLARKMYEKFPLMANGNCNISVRAWPRLPTSISRGGTGSGEVLYFNVFVCEKLWGGGIGFGNRSRPRTLMGTITIGNQRECHKWFKKLSDFKISFQWVLVFTISLFINFIRRNISFYLLKTGFKNWDNSTSRGESIRTVTLSTKLYCAARVVGLQMKPVLPHERLLKFRLGWVSFWKLRAYTEQDMQIWKKCILMDTMGMKGLIKKVFSFFNVVLLEN